MNLRNMAIAALLPCGGVVAQPCLTSFAVTTSPNPVNGTYGCGETVTICFTVTNWNATNANWFHGIEANFGPGWDMATLVPGAPPATCGPGAGSWGWYNNVSGQGPGFFFDLNNDGDPANNFGDFCVGATDWEFCWTITTVSGSDCINGLDLSIGMNTFSDSQTGAWGSNGCNNDANPPVFPGPLVIAACNADAGTGTAMTLCSSAAPVDLFELLTGSPDAGGVWTDPNGLTTLVNLDPAIAVSGNYTYTVSSLAPPCSVSSVVVITVNPQPVPGSNGTMTLCSGDAPVPLIGILGGSPSAGGNWTGPAGASNGTFDPAIDPAGIYTYLITATAPCLAVSATATLTVNPTPSAGTNGAISMCSTGAAYQLFNSLGGMPSPGGTWTGPNGSVSDGTYTPGISTPGNYTYTVSGIAPCANSSAIITVTETTQPSAGINAAISMCNSGSPFSMIAQLGGTPNTGGSWTDPNGVVIPDILNPATAVSGAYIYSFSNLAPCTDVQATLTITIVPASSAGTNGTVDVCSLSPAFPLIQYLGGSPTAGYVWTGSNNLPVSDIFTPGTSIPGTYTYTVSGIAPCTDATATVVVNVSPQPNAGNDAVADLCTSGEPFDLFLALGATAQTGGSWTDPNGMNSTGTISPSTALPGIYTYSITSLAPCTDDQATVSISINNEPDAGTDGAIALCDTGSPVDLFQSLNGTPDADGTWTGPNGPLGANFNPAVHPSGSYIYNVMGIAPCLSQSATVIVDVFTQPDPGLSSTTSFCSSSATQVDLFTALDGTPDPNGTWLAPNGQAHTGTFDPTAEAVGVYTYNIIGTPPCTDVSSTVTITMVQAPNAGQNLAENFCVDEASVDPFDWLDPTTDPSGTWTSPSGTVITQFDPSSDPSGPYTYTLVGSAPCPNDQAVATIVVSALPIAGSDNILTLCANGDPQNLFPLLGATAETNGTWAGPLGSSNGTFDPGLDVAGVYTYTVNGTAGCVGRTATAQITTGISATPVPQVSVVNASGCLPLSVQFLVTEPTTFSNVFWNFGDGSTANTAAQAWHVYNGTGTFSVNVDVTDSNGCHGLLLLEDAIFTSNGPSAEFIMSPLRLSTLDPILNLSHLPENYVVYDWVIENEAVPYAETFTWMFPRGEVGTYTICLTATDTLSCTNTECTEVLVDDVLTIYIPNAFTPDGNDVNEIFIPSVLGADPKFYSFDIFDRWGEQVFSSTKVGEGWNGRIHNNGAILPHGVYVWRLAARDQFSAETVEYFGSVTLLK